jgi:hypothetical protein
VLFLQLRQISLDGTPSELVERLVEHDKRIYHHPIPTLECLPSTPPITPCESSGEPKDRSLPTPIPSTSIIRPSISRAPSEIRRTTSISAPQLPVELLADILDRTGDWVLARAVGLPTSLVPPTDWVSPTPIDSALLAGYLPLVRAANPAAHPPSKAGIEAAIRLGYVHVLEYLRMHAHAALSSAVTPGGRIPVVASEHGRVAVLRWWVRHIGQPLQIDQQNLTFPAPTTPERAAAVDAAAGAGNVDVLTWWWAQRSRPGGGWSFECTEGALEGASRRGRLDTLSWFSERHVKDALVLRPGRAVDAASAAGRLDVLSWWARSGLELAYDRGPLRHASVHGRTDVLRWWAESGLQLVYDGPEVLVGATRHDQPGVLEWWDKSGLPVQYRLCDIEEALEDAIGGGERAREWWRRKGVNFNANDKEWMKMQTLN